MVKDKDGDEDHGNIKDNINHQNDKKLTSFQRSILGYRELFRKNIDKLSKTILMPFNAQKDNPKKGNSNEKENNDNKDKSESRPSKDKKNIKAKAEHSVLRRADSKIEGKVSYEDRIDTKLSERNFNKKEKNDEKKRIDGKQNKEKKHSNLKVETKPSFGSKIETKTSKIKKSKEKFEHKVNIIDKNLRKTPKKDEKFELKLHLDKKKQSKERNAEVKIILDKIGRKSRPKIEQRKPASKKDSKEKKVQLSKEITTPYVEPLGKTVYQFSVKTLQSEMVSMEKYRGFTLIIVNIATKDVVLGPKNLIQLNKLFITYRQHGLRIAAFPSNDFQCEPLDDIMLEDYCRRNEILFDVYAKVQINGLF